MALTGSTCSVMLSYIFPAIIFLQTQSPTGRGAIDSLLAYSPGRGSGEPGVTEGPFSADPVRSVAAAAAAGSGAAWGAELQIRSSGTGHASDTSPGAAENRGGPAMGSGVREEGDDNGGASRGAVTARRGSQGGEKASSLSVGPGGNSPAGGTGGGGDLSPPLGTGGKRGLAPVRVWRPSWSGSPSKVPPRTPPDGNAGVDYFGDSYEYASLEISAAEAEKVLFSFLFHFSSRLAHRISRS